MKAIVVITHADYPAETNEVVGTFLLNTSEAELGRLKEELETKFNDYNDGNDEAYSLHIAELDEEVTTPDEVHTFMDSMMNGG